MLLAAVALAVGYAPVHMDIIVNKVKSKLKNCWIPRFYNIHYFLPKHFYCSDVTFLIFSYGLICFDYSY